MYESAQDKRLRQALTGLKRHRRKQHADQGPWSERFGHWSVLVGMTAIFIGVGLDTVSYFDLGLPVTLGFFLCFMGLFAPALSPVLESVGQMLLLVVRIPSMLLFEFRMHLLELILIVALLGNGIGFIVSQEAATNAALAVFFCILWSIVVLGGAAWGLWVCRTLSIAAAWTRCSMILTGALLPASITGLAVSPFLALGGITCFQGRVHPLLLLAEAALIVVAATGILGRAIRYHSEARHAIQEQHRRDLENRKALQAGAHRLQ